MFEDFKKFKENYINYFESFKGNFNIKNLRYVFKSKDIKLFFGYDKFNEIIEDFVFLINEFKVIVSFVFFIFNMKCLREVKYYFKDNIVKMEKFMKFIDKLMSYFLYIIVWKLIREFGFNGIKVYLDNFDE